jgi:hypothetical protein
MFDVFYSGKKPNLFAFEKQADDLQHAATLSRTKYYWFIYGDNDYSKFDFEWRPAPWESQYIHVWPTQWNQYGGAYFTNKDTVQNKEWKFYQNVVPILADESQFITLHNIKSFDFSWRPHPFDPPYIYVFGNQWYGPERMPTVEYHVDGATERKYLYEPSAILPETTKNWVNNSDVPIEFDYSWCPDPFDPPYIYVFGNQHWEGERSSTIEYHVTGATEKKFIGDIRAKLSTLDIFFIDKGNTNAGLRFASVNNEYSHVQRVRYANSMFDTIKRCANRANTARFWVISSDNNYSDFDFDWQPEPWQHSMTHIFPSQWNKWSDTYLINKWEFERHIKWAKGLEEFPNLNFVSNQLVRAEGDGDAIYYIDHGNDEAPFRETLLRRFPKLKITRYANSYFDTLKRIISTATTEYIWVTSSVCDYSQFDFSWQPEPWQSEMIHVFPSNRQKRGDTFYINVESFKTQMYELEMLDWFNVINYCDDQYAPRHESPIIRYSDDTLVTPIKENDFNFPYAVFVPENHTSFYGLFADSPCLWSPKDKKIESLSNNGSVSVVPKESKAYIKTQIYDYPYVDKDKDIFLSDEDLNIVYISNGEPDAERWYDHLLVIMNHRVSNKRLHRVENVNGRIAAYHAAARASTTPWFFAVFAKLEIMGNFNFNWQPDYWQEPKHYIFHSRNCLNGLEYGHMGVIAYNKKLVLDTVESGLDFTLSQPHQVVPQLSATAYFNADPWMTWRTAFREVIKLKHFMAVEPTLETEHRLDTWLTVANGDNAEWCLRGAADAVEYYNEVDGDYTKLMLSFDWPWLKERFNQYNT